ncbi:MAG TPA: hypothetical protein VFI31_25530 [Pirellulales bacterium]|nr:hypothetical protein [Pirellulales bacterium]
MARNTFLVGVSILFCGTAAAYGQQASVVQLPSTSIFGADTTVSVPDRGSASLAGSGRSSTGSTAYGSGLLPGNRSFGSSTSGSNTSVRATVHDMDELDRQALSRAKQGGSKKLSTASDGAKRLAAARQSSAGVVPAGSVAEARRRRAAELESEQAEATANVERAREAVAAGKQSVAAMFYRLAARQATGQLKTQVEKEAAALAKAGKSASVAHGARPSSTPRRHVH